MTVSWTEPAKPTAVGQRVRARAWGGNVRQWMANAYVTGTVVRFTPKGNAVVALDGTQEGTYRVVEGNLMKNFEVSDTYSCFRCITADGKWINEVVEVFSK